ncbi:hypothetical protein PV325_012855 [Microctonus aethiopoides]|uniref:Carbohydrate sulfotransferase n=1 Tax=Microctonus aethiopoides TaxID=144406 RepID=A0AA39C5S9_9HYME|nr:hypothetical protein PV326_011014 [Microctonus aethiopoides]KAK0088188.1 hypothetical protein PV325_012855 [Microctonus aethiopoides]KAK0158440.1 hypothetical protein PV328_009440 [Microctonus aethiopoides]
MKILLSSTTTLSGLFLDNNGRHLGSLSSVTTLKSHFDDNYQDYKWLESESESEMSDESINQQNIETSLQRVGSICEKYNKTTSLEQSHFLYSSKHNILFCLIRKVASTSFTKLFADFRGIHATGNYYKLINVLAPKNVNELLNVIDDPTVFKFLAVRHPFERLVSFYRSRIEDNSKYTDQAWIFARKIFYITRPNLFHFNESLGNVLQQIFYNDRRLKLVPTFKEFIIWLLREPEEHDDPHWRQYHSHCSVCQMRLDYILKLDNYSIHDVHYIFSLMGSNKKQWKLPKLARNNKGPTNFALTCFYLSKLSKNILSKLFERYKVDFEMFDYNYDVYKPCVN